MKKICNSSTIWDLHIHTCKDSKGSGDFSQLSVEEYVSKINDLFSLYDDLEMISFTDHNKISIDVYNEFYNRNTKIKLIPGIEVDMYLFKEDYESGNGNYKHFIFYFDDSKFDVNKHAPLINCKLQISPLYIYDFLDFLISELKGIPFLISPHIFKQNNRGIDFDWNDIDTTKKNINKYMDQFYFFWETSSVRSIAHAIEFLKDFEMEEKISIISFSDSHSFDKLKSYLDNPKQYFNALSNFEGLRMVGSDCKRIKMHKEQISPEENGKYIGKVIQGNNEIYFTRKLNTIIGGRGNGKSLLIDGIALNINGNYFLKSILDNSRINYIKRLGYKVYNMNGELLENGKFKIDYFDQGYVLKLFQDNADIVTSHYFKDEFNKLENYNTEIIKSSILNDLNYTMDNTISISDNLTSIIATNKILSNQRNEFRFLKQRKELHDSEYENYDDIIRKIEKSKIIPKELRDNLNINKSLNKLIKTIYNEQFIYNNNIIMSSINNLIKQKYKNKLNFLNDERNKKTKILERIKCEIKNISIQYINRVKFINNMFAINNNYSKVSRCKTFGYNNSIFIFERKVEVEAFVDYLFRIFNEYFDAHKLKSKFNIDRTKKNILQLIKIYCYKTDDVIMSSKKIEELDGELFNLRSLKITEINNIYYKKNDLDYEKSLRNLSPGTKANYLMEYIVFKDSSVPLLIDQPEDNIDNSTIYKVLTLWFEDLKQKRQVIVATHDPNIVINSDAENVIICTQESNDIFTYNYGALEYGENINKVSKILDGGTKALERRLLKYGKD